MKPGTDGKPYHGVETNNNSNKNIFEAVAEKVYYYERERADILARQGIYETDVVGELEDVHLPIDSQFFESLIITQAIADQGLPDQGVKVEYLHQDQRLVLPVALGMTMAGPKEGRCSRNDVLAERYWRAANHTYLELKHIVGETKVCADIRAALMRRAPREPTYNGYYEEWRNNNWCTLEGGERDTPENILLVFATLSVAIQGNCDVRDFGWLNRDEMTVSDTAWKNIVGTPRSRLNSKLKPHTLHYLAALNYTPCSNFPMAAWVRAYGVSAGCLHAANRASKSEIQFTLANPPFEARNAVIDFKRTVEVDLFSLVLNLIAMFGVFHLNKDCTYRRHDPNIERCGAQYLDSIRTLENERLVESFIKNKETIVRTAAHPFGIAQAYWVFRMMDQYNLLYAPLALKRTATPPPVQRLMIVDTARKEWTSYPPGVILNQVYAKEIDLISNAVTQVTRNPPPYSALYRLYGIAEQAKLSNAVSQAINTMMPCVYGYAMANHVDHRNVKHGIALALSLASVERTSKSLVDIWTSMWKKYLDTLDSVGLVEFAQRGQLPLNLRQR